MIEETKFTLSEVDTSVSTDNLDKVTKGYFPVKVRSLFPGTLLPFDLHCLARRSDRPTIQLDKLFPRDRIYPLSLHQHLLKEELDDVFICGDDEEAFTAYLHKHTKAALGNRDLLPKQRAELLYDHAEYIIKRVFRERPSRRNIAIGQQVVTQLSKHALADPATLRALLAMFSKDYQTFSHCIHVAVYGMSLGKFLRWKVGEVESFGLGALFHDIAKTAIHEQILNKPGVLDKDEFDLIKRHPLLGYQQLRMTRTMTKDQLSIVLHHHEAEDGSGYPDRLKGHEIHKFARVARIVDIYDALTTSRPYKEAFLMQKALQVMNNQMKHTMDQRFLEAFIKLREMETNTAVMHLKTRLNIELGARVRLLLEDRPDPIDGVLAGLEVHRALVFRIPLAEQVVDHAQPGCAVVGKYRREDTLFRFHSVVLKTAHHPYPLLLVSYPRDIQVQALRKEASIDCAFRAKALIRNTLYPGTVIDLNADGCRITLGCPPQAVVINDNITISVEFSEGGGGEPIVAKVRDIKMAEEQLIVDVQFDSLSPVIREAINELVSGAETFA